MGRDGIMWTNASRGPVTAFAFQCVPNDSPSPITFALAGIYFARTCAAKHALSSSKRMTAVAQLAFTCQRDCAFPAALRSVAWFSTVERFVVQSRSLDMFRGAET
jgi:hypothetical protein